jgi:hypothetical protein
MEYSIVLNVSDPHGVPTIAANVDWLRDPTEGAVRARQQVVAVVFDNHSRRTRVPISLIGSGNENFRMMVICFRDIEGGDICNIVPRLFLDIVHHSALDDRIVLGIQFGSVFNQVFKVLTIAPTSGAGLQISVGAGHKPTCAFDSNITNIPLGDGYTFGFSVQVAVGGSGYAEASVVRGQLTTVAELDWIPRTAWMDLVDELRRNGMNVVTEDQDPTYSTVITRIEGNCDLALFPVLKYGFWHGSQKVMDIHLNPEDYVSFYGIDGCLLRIMPDDIPTAHLGWNILRAVVTQLGDNYIAFCDSE